MLESIFPFIGRAKPPPVVEGHSPTPLLSHYPTFGVSDTTLSGYATEQSLTGLPAADYCLNLIANAVAQMLKHGHVNGTEARPLICDRPNLLYPGSYEFWYEAVATCIVHGNYIALVAEVDTDGYALQVQPVHPSIVSLRLVGGFPVYTINGRDYSWRQVVHVRGFTVPGSRWGIGVLERHRRHLTAAYDEQTAHRTNVAHGGPKLVVSLDTPGMPNQDELDRLSAAWTTKYASGKREPAFLPRTMQVQPVLWTPEEAEFLESRSLTIAETAFIFGISPALLTASVGNGSALTYANLQERTKALVIDSYGPWLHRFEDVWSDLLPEGERFEGNVEALLRMTPEERMHVHILAQQAGIETQDESRAIYGKPPITQLPDAA